MSRTQERYPELRDFTERLLAGVTEVLQERQRACAPDTATRHPRPRRRGRRWAGLAGAAVAAGLAAALVAGLLPRGAGGPPDARAAAFNQAASVARNGPYRPLRPGEYWYTRKRTSQAVTPADKRYVAEVPLVREVWMGSDGKARVRVRSGPLSFPTQADRRAWVADGKPALGQDLDYRSSDLTYNSLRLKDDGTALDTDTRLGPKGDSLLYTTLDGMASIGDGRWRDYYQAVVALPTDPDALLRKLRQFATRDRRSTEQYYELSVNSGIYESAVELLSDESPAPPALRRALLQVLPRIPDVRTTVQVGDGAGRQGTQFVFAGTAPGVRELLGMPKVVIDPATGLLLSTSMRMPFGLGSADISTREVQRTVYLQYGVVPNIKATPPR